MDDNRDGKEKEGSARGELIKIDKERLNTHLDQIVRGTVEETLNGLLDAEADQLCQARRYERVEGRKDTRASYYTRKLQTKAGEVNLETVNLSV